MLNTFPHVSMPTWAYRECANRTDSPQLFTVSHWTLTATSTVPSFLFCMEKPSRKKSGGGGTAAQGQGHSSLQRSSGGASQMHTALIRPWFETTVFSVCGVSRPLT